MQSGDDSVVVKADWMFQPALRLSFPVLLSLAVQASCKVVFPLWIISMALLPLRVVLDLATRVVSQDVSAYGEFCAWVLPFTVLPVVCRSIFDIFVVSKLGQVILVITVKPD